MYQKLTKLLLIFDVVIVKNEKSFFGTQCMNTHP